jgi:hypothetical protein
LYQRARGGELTRVHRGCFVDTGHWGGLSGDSRQRALAHLAALTFGSELVFSHQTAAALWRLPILGRWPERAQVAGPAGSSVHRSATLARHALGIPIAPAEVDGRRLTSLALTVAQISASQPFAAGVVVADAALRRSIQQHPGLRSTVTSDELIAAASLVALNHGGSRALSVAEFADGRADRPGESLSRASMHASGISRPQLQVEVFGASGLRYFADFYWPSLRLIGEFDGKAKYSDPVFLRGRTPERALLDEKAREDDLRAAGYLFSRWGWDVALSPARLSMHLRRAGLR